MNEARKTGKTNMHQKATFIEQKKDHYKELLTQTIDQLLSERKKNVSEIDYLKNDIGDFTDQASTESDSALKLRIRERKDRLIKKINDALRRLEDGSFGICEECGREISEKRLMARPTATLCISCKEKEEAKENTGIMIDMRKFSQRDNHLPNE
jgi:DnaK suppressor protein